MMKIDTDTAKELPCNERERLWIAREQGKGNDELGQEMKDEKMYNERDSTQRIKAGEIRERENS